MKIQKTGIKFPLCSFEEELKSEPFEELVKIKQNENIENGYKNFFFIPVFAELVKIKQNENIENGYKISTVFIIGRTEVGTVCRTGKNKTK